VVLLEKNLGVIIMARKKQKKHTVINRKAAAKYTKNVGKKKFR
jgi:hypothetical protein